MARLTILEYPDPRLRTRAQPVSDFDARLLRLIDDMFETMYVAPGIGLAATQVNVHQRLIVIDVSKEANDPQVFINPEILTRAGVGTVEEGCLSVPGIFDDIERAARIRVRAQDRQGIPYERDFEGTLAVCLQHEIDHLEGRLFVDYLSDAKRERIRRKLDKDRKERASRPRKGAKARALLSARLRLAFAGTPRFAVPPLEALARQHLVVGVLTQPDRPAGRGQKLEPSPVKLAALALGVEVAQPAELKTAAGRASLAAWRVDLLVVAAYGLILPPTALELPRLGCVNIHASLLPRWRGAAPIQRAILAGDRETGVSIMRMEAGLDTGPVYLERRLPIGPETDAVTLQADLARLGAHAIVEALAGIAAGTLLPQPQAPVGVTYAAKVAKAEARIDWSRSAEQIDAQIRAFVPWPVAETRYQGEQLRIHRARPDPTPAPGELPGELGYTPADGLRVRCGAGALRLLELQRAGRRRVTADEFGRALGGARPRFE